MTDFLGYAVQGFFTGFGVIAAQHIYEMYFKPHMEHIKDKVNNGGIKLNSLNSDDVIKKLLK